MNTPSFHRRPGSRLRKSAGVLGLWLLGACGDPASIPSDGRPQDPPIQIGSLVAQLTLKEPPRTIGSAGVVLTSVLGDVTTAQLVTQTGPERIAFSSNRDGNFEVHSMNTDGSFALRLTSNVSFDGEPVFSPDGTRVAFHSNRDGNSEIYVMNANGSGLQRLTTNSATDENPSWSPDGSRLAFESNRDGNFEIYVMNTDGSAVQRLTNNADVDLDPSWSPDGALIAFVSNRIGGVQDVFIMNADGTLPRRPSAFSAPATEPAWSPVGRKLAFSTTRDGNPEIYVRDFDSTGLEIRITNNAGSDTDPSWSPDGTQIAFISTRDGNPEVYVMNADGSRQSSITQTSASESSPSWSVRQRTFQNLVGPGGQLGANAAGFLYAESGASPRSFLVFDAATRGSAEITPASSPGWPNLVFHLSADDVTLLSYVNLETRQVIRLIGAGALPTGSAKGALVSFDAATGQVVSVFLHK